MATDGSASRRPRRFATVRLRTTLLAVVVVGVVLVVAAVGLVFALRRAMTESVETAAKLRADDIAAALNAGERPDVTVNEPDAMVVQVVDASGGVVLTSGQIVSDAPMVDPRDGTRREREVAIRDDG